VGSLAYRSKVLSKGLLKLLEPYKLYYY